MGDSQDIVGKLERIRDPVHGLVAFSASNQFEQAMWSLIETPAFQRLRRIKQLGFSEFVYPGATHTRFAHSVGVFHTARAIVGVLKEKLGADFSPDRASIAVCAALLHDIGHGPFSHTFEGVEKGRGTAKKHEAWTAQIVREDGPIGEILDKEFRDQVAGLLEQESPVDIYSSVVSSQFDADRLDYLRRDKLMTGSGQGSFDWAWMMNNLEIDKLTIGGDDEKDPVVVDGLILGSKGLKAAEEYLLGRFHLYTQVYMHKATRGAEKMLGALLLRLAEMIADGEFDETGLPTNHPLVLYFGDEGNTLENYLALDDTVVWGGLRLMAHSDDEKLSELSSRLLNRDLYKCLDVGARAASIGSNVTGRYRLALSEAEKDGQFEDIDVLQDRATVSPYKFRDYESPDAFMKVMIRKPDGSGGHDDVADMSRVVDALREEKLFRVYGRTPEVMDKLEGIWKEMEK